jgi:hypothetical protein
MYIQPKNCIQILKSLNKNSYIIRLSDRLYLYAVHHIAEQKNKNNVKICTLRDCPFDRIFCVAGRLQ